MDHGQRFRLSRTILRVLVRTDVALTVHWQFTIKQFINQYEFADCSLGTNEFSVNIIAPQWGAADAEIKVLSFENTELKGSPFNAWSRSVYG